MTAFFDNTFYVNLTKEQDKLLYAQHNNNVDDVLYKVKEEVEEFDHFFVSKTPFTKVCRDDKEIWKYVLSGLTEEIFTSTSASYSCPETFAVKRYEQITPSQDFTFMLSPNHKYNSPDDLYSSSDILNYRKSRSENLLLRMIQCSDLDLSQVSLMRLSKGVFIHQKFESSLPHPSPTLSTIQECLYQSQYMDPQGKKRTPSVCGKSQLTFFTVEAPINTFHHNTMSQMMTNNNLTTQCYDMFIPYTYTFGARYTNPYGDSHDLIIRGRLPLWCQTLFLSNCLKQTDAIKPNETRLGLFPFAPHIPITFKHFDPDNNDNVKPELNLTYERITMEHLDPFALPDMDDTQWQEKKQEILRNILICDLPDDVAKVIEDLSIIWAASQGLDI